MKRIAIIYVPTLLLSLLCFSKANEEKLEISPHAEAIHLVASTKGGEMKEKAWIYTLLIVWVLLIAASFLLFEYLPSEWAGKTVILSAVFATVYIVPVVTAVITIWRFRLLSWLPRCLGLLPACLGVVAFVCKALVWCNVT